MAAIGEIRPSHGQKWCGGTDDCLRRVSASAGAQRRESRLDRHSRSLEFATRRGLALSCHSAEPLRGDMLASADFKARFTSAPGRADEPFVVYDKAALQEAGVDPDTARFLVEVGLPRHVEL